MREAISVEISGGTARYSHVVRLRHHAPETGAEQGDGKISGQAIVLQGSWTGNTRHYTASYSGTFVRRTVRLRGTQTWTDDGKSFTRACSGAIKRPLKAFLPRANRPPGAR